MPSRNDGNHWLPVHASGACRSGSRPNFCAAEGDRGRLRHHYCGPRLVLPRTADCRSGRFVARHDAGALPHASGGSLERLRRCRHRIDVGRDDVGNDAAERGPHDPHLCGDRRNRRAQRRADRIAARDRGRIRKRVARFFTPRDCDADCSHARRIARYRLYVGERDSRRGPFSSPQASINSRRSNMPVSRTARIRSRSFSPTGPRRPAEYSASGQSRGFTVLGAAGR